MMMVVVVMTMIVIIVILTTGTFHNLCEMFTSKQMKCNTTSIDKYKLLSGNEILVRLERPIAKQTVFMVTHQGC